MLYDSEGEKKCEGFMIGEAYVCYGTRYYSDIQRVEYEGEWCGGKRWRKGVQYDRRGYTVFEGEWLNDEHEMEKKVVVSDDRPTVLHNRVEELFVPSESRVLADWKSLECSLMPRLRVLAIGSNCAFAGAVELVGGGLLGERCDRRRCLHRSEALHRQGLSRSEDAGHGQRLLLGMLLLYSPVPADAGVCAVRHDGE